MIRLLLVDDHQLVRTGIRRLLDDIHDIDVIAEAACGEEAIAAVRKDPPDVILMDVSMPGIGGLEATKRLKATNPDIPVVIVTVHTDDPFPNSLLKAGAMGYLHKGCSVMEIDRAIHEVHAGQRYLSTDIAQSLALSLLPGGGGDSPFEGLSTREMQVLEMMSRGNKVGEIAEQLSLSPKTISTYRRRIFNKLSVNNDAELTRLAMRYGILDGGN
jgi:two-component system, NarL family, invasion response regulator UvrY